MDKKEEFYQIKEEYQNSNMDSEQIEGMKGQIRRAKMENRRESRRHFAGKTVAAAMAVFLILPNVSSQAAYAMGNLPVIGNLVKVVTLRDYKYQDERSTADISIPELVAESSAEGATQANKEIKQITDQLIAEFETNLKNKEGYQNYTVKHETIASKDPYFTLKMSCFQNAGSGSEWDYYYTIDQTTGQRIQMQNLFKDGSDYITPISDNIKQQMRAQMAADSSKIYWIDTKDMPQMDFKQIRADQNFYINADNKLVIVFDEGEAGPMYMGCVEFVIDDAAIGGVRK